MSDDAGRRVGAREKIEKAQMVQRGGAMTIRSKREGKESSPVIGVTVVLGLAVLLATLLGQGLLKDGVDWTIGIPFIDNILFGSGEPVVTGQPALDQIIVLLSRGLALAAVFGVFPVAAKIWMNLLDSGRANVYIVMWGVLIGVVALTLLTKDYFIPIARDLLMTFMPK